MGLGPGGQPINANRLSSGGGVASMGPGGQSALNFLSFFLFFGGLATRFACAHQQVTYVNNKTQVARQIFVDILYQYFLFCLVRKCSLMLHTVHHTVLQTSLSL